MAIKKFCVIGLGHFGLNLALRLTEEGGEVIAIDKDQDRVDLVSESVVYAVRMDSTDQRALRSLDVQDMDAVIVAIGEGFEDSIMTTAALQEIGVKKIINRITSPVHERLLRLMGIEELLVPEAEAASHLANRLLMPGIIESFELTKDYGIYEIEAPDKFVGKKLIDLDLRSKYRINVVTIKRIVRKKGFLSLGETSETEITGVPDPKEEIKEKDILVLFGREENIRALINKS
ncbi:MAG: potassium channel family protein [Candidatus Kapaibacterium sp.]